jgi:hypothetical protein
MLDNLKKLTSEMDLKSDFVKEVAKSYGMSYKYIKKEWFIGSWNIPEAELETIVKMAQNYLFLQTQRQNKILESTGFKQS